MSDTTCPFTDAEWAMAQIMMTLMKVDDLTRPFRTKGISKQKQEELQLEIVDEVIAASRHHPKLAEFLEGYSDQEELQRELVLSTTHLLRRAYSACSSVYPRSWFDRYRSDRTGAKYKEPVGDLVFMAPGQAVAEHAVA